MVQRGTTDEDAGNHGEPPSRRTGLAPARPDDVLVWGAAGAGSLFALVTMLVITAWAPLVQLDADATAWSTTHLLPRPVLVDVLQGVTDGLGPWTFRTLVAALAVALALRGQRRLALWAVLVTWGGGLLVTVVKLLVDRERPDLVVPLSDAAGSAYPSGHALGATVGCAVLLVLVRPGLGRTGLVVAAAVAVTVAGLVSFTRVALGVHHLSDVTGGVLLGLTWLALVTLLVRPLHLRGGRP
jgi:membrane-associated phospholipid phosphatase